MLSEVNHIQEIVQSLCMVSNDPDTLPGSTEHLLADMLKSGSDSESTVCRYLFAKLICLMSHIMMFYQSRGFCQFTHIVVRLWLYLVVVVTNPINDQSLQSLS